VTPIAEGWRVRPIESFTIDGDVARSRADAEYRSCRLGDLSDTMPAFAGTVAYAVDVDLKPPEPGDVLVLDLGTVYYAADVYVNGELAGRRAWSPYWFDITDRVAPGSNRVEVRVTGTLAAAWLDAVGRMDRAWRNTYVERVEPWAAEGRRLGIAGPVTLKRWREGGGR
jgi:hypothetical protein